MGGFVSFSGKDALILDKELKGRVVKQGDKINFKATQTAKGSQATDITVVNSQGEDKYKGVVKQFVLKSGYGFITCEAFPGQDIFFLMSELKVDARDKADKGDMCCFKVEQTAKGLQATEVILVAAAGNKVADAGKGMRGMGNGNMMMMDPSMMMMMLSKGKSMGKGKSKGVKKQMFQKGW